MAYTFRISRCERSAVLALLLLASALQAHGQTSAMLSAEQRAIVDGRGEVFLTWDVRDSPWPRACVFEYIDAPPEEAAAAFADYPRHRAYIPGIRKAKVSRIVDASTAEVDYTLEVPIVADEDYTVRDHLSLSSDSASYIIEWTLVRATSAKATEGSVRFEPHQVASRQRAGTLMSYCNLVTPGSGLAKLSFIKSRALKQVRETARAIREEVERLRAGDRALLDAEVERLRSALASTSAP